MPKEGTIEVAGGETDEFGHVRLGGIGQRLEREIEERTGYETRAVVLGHIQRGGTPTAYDRVLATRFGVAAIDAAHDGRWGMMPALRGDRNRARRAGRGGAELRTRDPGGVSRLPRRSWASGRGSRPSRCWSRRRCSAAVASGGDGDRRSRR